MRRCSRQRGMSLVEATIILLVLMLLTGVLAPSIFDFVIDAKMVKVKEDCEAIGVTVARMVRDVGPCFRFHANVACTGENRVEILVSDGSFNPTVDVLAGLPDYNDLSAGATNWQKAAVGNPWSDSMENQFVVNTPLYPTPSGNPNVLPPIAPKWNWTYPSFGLGWRGAYLSPPIGPDPWGKPYMVNSIFLAVPITAPDGVWEGMRHGGYSQDVFCISPGPNAIYETPIGRNHSGDPCCSYAGGTLRMYDDFIYIISGDTR